MLRDVGGTFDGLGVVSALLVGEYVECYMWITPQF